MTKFIYALFIVTSFIACKEQAKDIEIEPVVDVIVEDEPFEQKALVAQTVDDYKAEQISKYIKEELLKNKLDGLSASDRQFKIYKIDLNSDRSDETIVHLLGRPFCSSDGCTFLILDNTNKQVAKFAVLSTSIYVSSITETNGWKDLMVETEGTFKNLKFKNGTYPKNPSLEPSTDKFPNGGDIIVFDEGLPSKTYYF